MFESVSFSKISFYLQPLEDMLLPFNKASMFRGGFGHIFKRLNCVNKKAGVCSDCPLKDSCSYSYIFESSGGSDIPNPYIFETAFNDKREYLENEIINFDLLLFGKASQYAPFFIFSFVELGQCGLTKKLFKYKVKEVLDFDKSIVFDGNKIIAKAKTIKADALIVPSHNISRVEMNFLTPLRLTENGKLLSKPTFEHIVKAATRRINSVTKYHCGGDIPVKNYLDLINKSHSVSVLSSGLKWVEWTRHSNRQKTKMQFGGLLGSIIFEGDLTEFMPYLVLAQTLHIGKSCVFGLGKFELNF